MRILLMLLCALCLNSLQAQGYLGKRVFITAVFETNPALFFPTARNKGLKFVSEGNFRDFSGLRLNTRYQLSGGYVLNRRTSLVGGVSTFRTGLDTRMLLNTNPFDVSDFSFHDVFYEVRGAIPYLGLQLHSLKKGSLAPYGAYTEIRIERGLFNGTVVEEFSKLPATIQPNSSQLDFYTKRRNWALGFSGGVNHIIADQFILNFGITFRLSTGLAGTQFREAFSLEQREGFSRNELEFQEKSGTRLGIHSMLTYQIGFGYLLF